MKTLLKRFFTSYISMIVLLAIYAVVLAVATFIEKYYGTPVAKAQVYHSPLFFLLQLLMVVNFVGIVLKRKFVKQKRWAMLTLHASFILIFCGALVTYIFGQEGVLHVREGETTQQMVVRQGDMNVIHHLPFSVELKKFTLSRYPGSSSPSSYESEVILHVDGEKRSERIYMNNILDVKGYRLFQASYDPDERGTILTVNQDVAGRILTYIGYFFLFVALIWSLFASGSRFTTLRKQLRALRKEAIVLLFFTLSSPLTLLAQQASGQDYLTMAQQYAIHPDHAAKFGSLLVQSEKGRMMPINTFSSELLRKLYKSETIGKLNADQFLLGLLVMPDVWMQVPLIQNKNSELAAHYHLSPKYCAYLELFDTEGDYKLQEKLEEAYHKNPAERTRWDKDLLKLDEQANIIHQLTSGGLLRLFPKEDDPDHLWYAPGDDLSDFVGRDSLFVSQIMMWYVEEVQTSIQTGDWKKANEVLDMIAVYQEKKNTTIDIDPKRIETEIKYNKLQIFRYVKIGYLSLGGILLILSFVVLFKPNRWIKIAYFVLGVAVLLIYHYQMVGMGMRWYIGGYAPWSNSYETMIYVAWATVTAGLLFARRSQMTFALATLFAGIILFVSGLNWLDPQINPLVPVLKSPWLMFHVAVIVAAYGFFGISFLLGLTNLSLWAFSPVKRLESIASRIKELSIINEMSLWIGIILMTIGTFLGAIWANESWGRYWGWDPKETWALITMIVYAIVTHLHLMKGYSQWLFNLLSVVAFASVLMTYFGVNYFLSGMHSYGQSISMNGVPLYVGMALLVITLLAWAAYRKQRTIKQ
ncbi:MAG: cytochrome c biogenesis protein CcsA [Phocaeicola sp.]